MKLSLSASITSIALLLFLIFGYNTPTKSKTATACKVAVFDLGGVLLETSSSGAFQELGVKLASWVCHDAPSWSISDELKKTYFSFLNKVTPRAPECPAACDASGLLLPQCMCDWMSGKTSSADLLGHIDTVIEANPEYFASKREKKLIKALCQLTFTPEKLAKTRVPIKKMWQLLRDCKEEGFKIYVLSNWDAESFKHMLQRFPYFEELIDGILLSADAGTIKPDVAIFHQLFEKFNITPEHSIFFDDRIENIAAAKKCGMNTVWCHKGKKLKHIVEDFEDLADYVTDAVNALNTLNCI